MSRHLNEIPNALTSLEKNICLDALICDFGCSRMIAASRSLANLTSGFKKTPCYMAYELLASNFTGHTMKTDVWAFGMTVFELSTLQRPYVGSELQVIAAIQRRELPSFPPQLSLNLQLEVVNTLKGVCLACWKRNPVKRPVMTYVVKTLEDLVVRRDPIFSRRVWFLPNTSGKKPLPPSLSPQRGSYARVQYDFAASQKVDTHYSLRVVRLEDVQWKSEAPDLYVKVTLGDIVKKTRIIKKNKSPAWNETLAFPSLDASAVFHIRVKAESRNPMSNPHVGYIDVKLEDLLEKCARGEEPAGVIHLYLTDTDAEMRVGIDVESSAKCRRFHLGINGGDDPFEKLNDPVSDIRSFNDLDELYATALKGSGTSWTEPKSKDQFSKVLALILFGKIPLSDDVIDNFLGFEAGTSCHTLEGLRSILYYEPGKPIHPFHPSFADYLLSSKRSDDPWFIDIDHQRQMIATRCFDAMARLLRFNICKLQTSFVRNDDVPGLQDRIKDEIPPHLTYACHFWAQHLRDVPSSPALLDKLSMFVYNHLLYWFEVLSLTKNFNRLAGRALLDVVLWAASSHTGISSFLWDAYRLACISASPISQSTPHIYLSALSLSKESAVSGHYSKAHPVVRIHRSGTKAPAPCIKIFRGHSDRVNSVAFSPDGKRAVSGSEDNSIRVRDAESGEVISGPFEGHTDSVTSVAFSPDGTRVVSGSWDHSIRVWDAESGEAVSGPFQGHTDSVNSAAFSSDGKCVVSGSWDNSIRVWDAESGEVDSGLFKGRTDSIGSAAFSSGATHLVTGSPDSIIRVSNADNGDMFSMSTKGSVNSNWTLSEDGWILGEQRELLIWIPDDMRETLWRPRNTAVFSCPFSTRVDFTDGTVGENWHKGFNSS